VVPESGVSNAYCQSLSFLFDGIFWFHQCWNQVSAMRL
jgi:hypothetical protein